MNKWYKKKFILIKTLSMQYRLSFFIDFTNETKFNILNNLQIILSFLNTFKLAEWYFCLVVHKKKKKKQTKIFQSSTHKQKRDEKHEKSSKSKYK